MCPRPPIPIIAHSKPALPCLLRGANTVIPAHMRGAQTSSGIEAGMGKAHLAGA